MELEVSYNENYCVEGQVERRRGATESIDGGGEVVGVDCVDKAVASRQRGNYLLDI